MKFGLKEEDLTYIIRRIKEYDEIVKASIFGSRVKDNYKPGSDIDIAIFGENVDFNTVSSLHAKLEEEGPLPYFFDIVDYTHLNHKELQDHIDRIGKVIFEKEA